MFDWRRLQSFSFAVTDMPPNNRIGCDYNSKTLQFVLQHFRNRLNGLGAELELTARRRKKFKLLTPALSFPQGGTRRG